MYANEIGRIDAEPQGAADTAPTGWLPGAASGWPGRYAARCLATAIGPMTADAGLVPCADCGIRHTVRWPSPRARWYARIASSPAYSPCAPELGCSDTAAKPVISASQASS